MNGLGIAIIAMIASNVTLNLFKHGEQRGEYHFGWAVFGAAIAAFIYYKAGLFN